MKDQKVNVEDFKMKLLGYKKYNGVLGNFYYLPKEYKIEGAGGSTISYIGDETDGSKIEIPYGLKNARTLFANTNIESAPEIPDTIENAQWMFLGCGNLETCGDIPDSVIDASEMFSKCYRLHTVGKISKSLKNAYSMFEECWSLLSLDISNSLELENCEHMFKNCTSLESIGDLPASIKDSIGMFELCVSLRKVGKIPSNNRDISKMFHSCYSLESIDGVHGGGNFSSSSFVFERCHKLFTKYNVYDTQNLIRKLNNQRYL